MKVYELFLKLTTYLNRQNYLTNKMIDQERELGGYIIKAQQISSPEVFNQIFRPMTQMLENRVKTMNEMRENANDFNDHLKEFFDVYKGVVQ